MKYQVKESKKKSYTLICIGCGKRKTSYYPAALPRPNTTQKIVKGSMGPMPGSWLGCKLGNHDYYGEHEVESIR